MSVGPWAPWHYLRCCPPSCSGTRGTWKLDVHDSPLPGWRLAGTQGWSTNCPRWSLKPPQGKEGPADRGSLIRIKEFEGLSIPDSFPSWFSPQRVCKYHTCWRLGWTSHGCEPVPEGEYLNHCRYNGLGPWEGWGWGSEFHPVGEGRLLPREGRNGGEAGSEV